MKPWNEQDSNDGEEDRNQKGFRDGTYKIGALIRNWVWREKKITEDIFNFSALGDWTDYFFLCLYNYN